MRNLATFMLAGHETTAVALTWTLWLLAKYPHVQDQVAAEAHATIGSGAVEASRSNGSRSRGRCFRKRCDYIRRHRPFHVSR